jgi:hypothetical protein
LQGSLQGTPVGSSTRSSGAFTSLTANSTVTLSPASANVTLSPTGTGNVTIAPAAAGSINNMSIGATTRSTAQFTTLNTNNTYTATGQILITNTTASSSVDSGALQVDGGVGIAGALYAGSIQGTPIGSTTRSNGAFLTLDASGTISFTQNSPSTTTTTGTLRVTGGVGVTGQVTAATVSGSTIIATSGSSGIIGYENRTGTATLPNTDRKYIVSNTGAITLTLPSTTTDGRTIVLADGNNFSSFNVTVARGPNTIGGLAENLILNLEGSKVELVYRGGDWKVFAI